jgi:hypothetical protein
VRRPEADRKMSGGVHRLELVEDGPALLSAVREDIRQTLRTGWIDPAIETAAANPTFFTAAWSAVRPNVGRSFLALARAIRAQAVDSCRSMVAVPDLRQRLRAHLADEELRRLEETVRAMHLAMPKLQIVVHAMHRAARRERIPGTGKEEPPVRRGIPEWQRWMSAQPVPEQARQTLDRAVATLGLTGPPTPLRMLARWPAALEAVWDELRPRWPAEDWRLATARLRRMTLAGLGSLPHPIHMQWSALHARGFTETERVGILDRLRVQDASMPAQTMAAALEWVAFGAPEVGVDG